MRYLVDVKSDKEKEFLQIMKVLKNLRVVKSCKKAGKIKEKGENKSASLEEELKGDVSSREMANQYRDLVD
jgi:hypothetical protein